MGKAAKVKGPSITSSSRALAVAANMGPDRGCGALLGPCQVRTVSRPIPIRQPEVVRTEAERELHLPLEQDHIPSAPRQKDRTHVSCIAGAIA